MFDSQLPEGLYKPGLMSSTLDNKFSSQWFNQMMYLLPIGAVYDHDAVLACGDQQREQFALDI